MVPVLPLFLPAVMAMIAALCQLSAAVADVGDEDVQFQRPQKPGFRTDVGIHLSFGTEQCLAGTRDHGACEDFGVDWDAGFGMALGVLVRPGTYLSYGLDASFMNISGQLTQKDTWLELTVGPTVRLHLPIRYGRLVLEPALGVSFGYAESHLRYKIPDEASMRLALYGPYVGILPSLSVFFLPGFGVGIDLRIHKMFYQEVCVKDAGTRRCRGLGDERSKYYSVPGENEARQYPGEISAATFSWKIYYGGHVVYYF